MLINASKIMKFVVLSNAIMAFIFFNFLLKRISIPAIISLVASSLFFLLPIEKFVTKLFVKEIERGDSGNYYDYYKRFKHYDLLNPVTKARGASRLEGNSLRDAIRRCIINRIKNQINKNESTKMEGLLDDGFGISDLNMYLDNSNQKRNSETNYETNNSRKSEENKSEEMMNKS